MNRDALKLEHVSVPGRLAASDLTLPTGALVGLVGPNGAGKSTLLLAAAGLLGAGSGRVSWGDENVSEIAIMERARRTAWVPQEARFEFGFSVRAVVQQGRYAQGDDEAGVDAMLARFDLTALAERPVNRLSGGERQRVLLARACVTGAKLQLWDEPLASLDPRHALEVLKLATEIKATGSTVVMSLHDLRLAHCLDLVVVMDRGRVVATGKPEAVLTADRLREVFGVTMRTGDGLILGLP